MSDSNPWDKELMEIERRRSTSAELGGADAVDRQHQHGRLTIRERIQMLIDDNSFHEMGPIAGHSSSDESGTLSGFEPSNYVLGISKILGRRCVVGGEDFTQRGGSPSQSGLRKSVYAETLALKLKVPLVRLIEGGGGSVTGSSSQNRSSTNPVYTTPRFRSISDIMGVAPVVSAAMGPVAGFPAARLVASHFSIMVKDKAQVMIGGPALVERALGDSVSKEDLGGSRIHARSGVVDNLAQNEEDACVLIRKFLSYLPTNILDLPPITECDDDVNRRDIALRDLIPRDRRKVYNARTLLSSVLDYRSIFEMTPEFGRSQITCLARIGGQPVGILANDPCFYAGAMTADGAQKVRRFVDLCDTFHLPIVSFVDEPGFMIGREAEQGATIRYGTAALFAVQQSRVPWISVIVRKAYGVAAAAHFGPEGIVLAWPSAESGPLPIEGGVAVAFRREIAAANDPAAKRAELEEEWASKRSPFPSAEGFAVHDLIDPADTRSELARWIEWTKPLLQDLKLSSTYTYRP